MMNTDYPAGNPTLNLVPFDDPPIEQCTLTTTGIINPSTNTHILDGNGRPRIYTNQVIEKTGGTSTIDDQYRNHNPNDDIDSDIDSDSDSDSGYDAVIEAASERGYLYIPNEDHELMQTHYGGVYRGNVLERDDNDNWQKTEEECVIKALGWDKIIAGREERRVEDPRTEIAAMILLWNCYNLDRPVADRVDYQNATAAEVREAMRQTNIIMPLDFLYDNENLYIIMPLCSEGEILTHGTFSEETCRTYALDTPSLSGVFPQMLNGFKWLQKARIGHRDLSLENFVIDGNCLIMIDFGLAIRIPYLQDGTTRQLIDMQDNMVGKPPYMSPEIFDMLPFDGHAVDLWSAGIVLYLLLIGRHPLQRLNYSPPFENCAPNLMIPNRLMYDGYLAQICRLEGGQCTDLALELLQNMLQRIDHHRLCLQQIRTHQWLSQTT